MLSTASGTMSNNGSYKNDWTPGGMEPDYSIDPASGGFFHSDYKKHDDLKEMLDSNKDSLKLEAMKRIIGMVAKGRDASDLFPAVVKNVVSKNIEVKKLVYVYLVRYAEEQQDLALLSISTFQRALKEPNQLIRAGALRVLSSIRVSMIVPIVMLAIRDAAADMSPYVRKTAAHAIPKLYSLDQEQKPELITVIQKLLADRTVLVVGSAVMAFTEVCPERVDLIHQVFRKLCTLLVDVDEWGQVVIVNMLTRYARTQFADPNLHDKDGDSERPFYDSGSDVSEKASPPALDPDHRLLLRSARPLLQSRNAAVVMAVAQLYHHCAPKSEGPISARALVRLLRSHTEVQSVVLDSIASISCQNKGTFEPYLKSFFIRTSDPTRIKLLKLDILTNLATESNVSVILRELQTYISSSDKQFVAATIQAIGRCACSISEITDSCLNGLVILLSNKDEAVVAESVVVIKRLLQTQAADPKEIIMHMTRLLDSITVAQARAAILWLLGEHSAGVPRIAPDVLRKLAKTFSDEHDIVKLQVLNLAVKLYITNPEETKLLCQYVFNLARYDQNYDIRDRARLLKQFTQNQSGKIASQATRIFLATKPAPLLQSQFTGRERLQLGSLSHYINTRAAGYEPLPSFPEHPPPSEVRDVEPIAVMQEAKSTKSDKSQSKKKLFLWESEVSSAPSSSSGSSSSSSGSESSDEEATTESDDQSSEPGTNKQKEETESSSEESESSSSESEEESSGEQSDQEKDNVKKPVPETKLNDNKPKSNLDLLLDLDDIPITPIMTPSLGGFLTPLNNPTPNLASPIQVVPPSFIPTKGIELLDRINGQGLSITYRFTRNPHLFSSSMVNISLTFTNTSHDDITDIQLGKKNLAAGTSIHEFMSITLLSPNCSLAGTLGIDFNDSTNPANLEILSSKGSSNVHIKPNIGELMRPVTMSEEIFVTEQSRLKGMNEHTANISLASTNDLSEKVFRAANVAVCPSTKQNTLRFAGQSLTSSSLILITTVIKEEQVAITVNCEKMIIGSMLLNELKLVFK
ncbi:hypothetical protein ILUMI_25696 [Ignelater luminosus]|uniref:AP-3 complex subunit beta n=1 Tax=Ignelater luminosus TaxID=2038154 RepID=A0A8K0C6Z8_IGNLU|nr:hypothetical protein ILUMI_25696 [Ignelater luminosus]